MSPGGQQPASPHARPLRVLFDLVQIPATDAGSPIVLIHGLFSDGVGVCYVRVSRYVLLIVCRKAENFTIFERHDNAFALIDGQATLDGQGRQRLLPQRRPIGQSQSRQGRLLACSSGFGPLASRISGVMMKAVYNCGCLVCQTGFRCGCASGGIGSHIAFAIGARSRLERPVPGHANGVG